jgi:hypothetical protein
MSIYNPVVALPWTCFRTQMPCHRTRTQRQTIMSHYEKAWQAVRDRIARAARAAGRAGLPCRRERRASRTP